MKNFSGITDNLDITTKKYVDDSLASKANLAGDNTFTGGQTITGATNAGYSVNASGYVKGSWLQSSVMQNKGSNTGKICVFDNAGWIYYRTPAEILAEAGGAKINGGNVFAGSQLIGGETSSTTILDCYERDGPDGTTIFGVNHYANSSDNGTVFIGGDTNNKVEVRLNENAGTSGQVIASQGTGETPKWITLPITSATLDVANKTLYLTLPSGS